MYKRQDGNSGGDSLKIATEMSELAKKKSIVINTIALMEPSAMKGIKLLAENTGGTAIMVLNEVESEDLITGDKIVRN